MTISSQVTRLEYLGNGATTVFAVTFPFFAASDLRVYTLEIATGIQTLLLITTGYSVVGGGGGLGAVTTVATYAATHKIIIERDTSDTQLSDYQNQAAIPAETLEHDFDRAVMRDQEAARELNRSLRFPASDPLTLNSVLPPAAIRKGGVLTFNSITGEATVGQLSTLVPGNVVVGLTAQALLPLNLVSQWQAFLFWVDNVGGVDHLSADVIAARPTPAQMGVGFYFATDERRTYHSDGAAWTEMGIVQSTFSGLPAPALAGKLVYDSDNRLLLRDTGAALVETRAPLVRGAIGGFRLARVDATTISIAAGEARVGTAASPSLQNAYHAPGSTYTKVTAGGVGWIAGSGNVGRAAGVALAANTWFHVFLLTKTSGAIDFGFDTSAAAVNLLADAAVSAAGFTRFRRLGSFKTDGASSVIPFTQLGDEFVWSAPPALESSTNANQSGADKTMTLANAPTGYEKVVHLVAALSLGAGNQFKIVGSHESINASPNDLASPLADLMTDDRRRVASLLLDSSNTVVFRNSSASNSQLHTQVLGWTDFRGRFD